MEKIKNCPFCKSDRVEVYEKKSRGALGRDKVSYYVKCHNCQARGPAFGCYGKTNETWRKFALHDWNKAPREVENDA